MNDLFFILFGIDIWSFADDITPFAGDLSVENILRKVVDNGKIAIFWFESNYMKINNEMSSFDIRE